MLTQENKFFSIETPLGTDVLLLARMRGREGMSELFYFEIDLFSEQQAIPLEEIVGKNVTISIFLADGSIRYLNGLVSRFGQEHGSRKQESELQSPYYSATVVPWLWLLTKTSNSRIFQNLSIPDIVKKIFTDQGLTDFKLELQSQYEPREYTVQYRESDFNFISRLLEEEGIYYFFAHESGKHIMVLADYPGANKACPDQETAKFRLSGGEHLGTEDQISSLKMIKEIQAGKYSLNDYNYKIPNTYLGVTSDTTHALGPGEREKYDYPGVYATRNAGDKQANLRMEEEEVRITTLSGSSDCRAFMSGFRFRLENTSRDDWDNKEYLLTSIQHEADQAATYFGASSADGKKSYKNNFTCIPYKVPYRPARNTKRPVVEGVQTAIVVGPAGEEIYTDDYGRVKVQFHWDREGENNENSSGWIRVSQSMAGNNWGAMFLPRIGHEVIVEFLEGNPDRPIITGQVYHGINRPPYKLPDEKTKSTIKSNSSPNGIGFNEIRFEDKTGKEQVFIHCEYDHDIRVKHDRREWIGNESHQIVLNDQFEKTGGDKHLTVTGDHKEKVDGTIYLEAGMDMQEKVGMRHALDAGQEIHLKSGMNIIIEAGAQISLKAGGNFIDISPAGITIQGTMVMINSGGAPGSGSGVALEAPILPDEADDSVPGDTVRANLNPGQTQFSSSPPLTPQAKVFKDAAESGTPLCDT